jgi:hypothetical protein
MMKMMGVEAGTFHRNKADRAIQECHSSMTVPRKKGLVGDWVVAISEDFP